MMTFIAMAIVCIVGHWDRFDDYRPIFSIFLIFDVVLMACLQAIVIALRVILLIQGIT